MARTLFLSKESNSHPPSPLLSKSTLPDLLFLLPSLLQLLPFLSLLFLVGTEGDEISLVLLLPQNLGLVSLLTINQNVYLS